METSPYRSEILNASEADFSIPCFEKLNSKSERIVKKQEGWEKKIQSFFYMLDSDQLLQRKDKKVQAK